MRYVQWIVIIYHCLQDNHVSFVSVIFINFIILGHIVQPYTHVIIFSTMFASNKILIFLKCYVCKTQYYPHSYKVPMVIQLDKNWNLLYKHCMDLNNLYKTEMYCYLVW